MDEFTEYFSLAQSEALTERESLIVELRYGLTGSDYHTLEGVGRVIGVSRERIRQLLARAHRKIRGCGRRQIKRGLTDGACAQLLLWLTAKLQPQEVGATARVLDFIEHNLVYLPPETALSLIQGLIEDKSSVVDWDQAGNCIRAHRRATVAKSGETARFNALLSYVIWPTPVNIITQGELAGICRVRDVSSSGDGYAGTFDSAKMRRVVQFESLLERDFYLILEECPEVIHYQEQPFHIPYQVKEKELSYYPDVLFVLASGEVIVTEIKPIFQMALHQNLNKWAALRKFCASNGWGMLVTDGRHAIQEVQHKTVLSEFSQAVLSRLDDGPMFWLEYKALREQYNVNKNDFLALVLQRRLVWTLGPFKLARHDQ